MALNSFKLYSTTVYTHLNFTLLQTDQGIKNIFQAEADRLAGADPDYANRDLYESIVNGNFVSEFG